MFLTFIAFLLGGTILPVAIFLSGEVVGMSGLAVPSPSTEKSSLWRAVGYGRIFTQTYVWLGWAAYCCWLALRFGVEPDVANPWVYYTVALLATSVPVAVLRQMSRSASVSDEELGQLQRGANLWRLLLLFGFCIFLVAPVTMTGPYAWLSRAQQFAVGDATRGVMARFQEAQSLIISNSDDRVFVASGAPKEFVPATPGFITTRWPNGPWRQTSSAVEAPCETEPDERLPEREQDQRLPENKGEVDRPCTEASAQE